MLTRLSKLSNTKSALVCICFVNNFLLLIISNVFVSCLSFCLLNVINYIIYLIKLINPNLSIRIHHTYSNMFSYSYTIIKYTFSHTFHIISWYNSIFKSELRKLGHLTKLFLFQDFLPRCASCGLTTKCSNWNSSYDWIT